MAAPACWARLRLVRWHRYQSSSFVDNKRRFSLCIAKQQKKKSSKKQSHHEHLYRIACQTPAQSGSGREGRTSSQLSEAADDRWSGVPVSDQPALSFKQLLHQRYNEAKRSVVIRTQNPESTIQSLASFGGLKHAHFTSQDKGYVLAQFASEDSITKLQRSAGFFSEPNQFPMQSRVFFDTSAHLQKKRTPIPQIKEGNWPEKSSNIYPEMNTIDQELEELCARRSLSDNDFRSRFFVCLQLEELLQSLLPEAHVIPYGSCLNGFGWWNSDLDMMLCFNKLYGTNIISSPVQNGQSSSFKILTETFSSSRHLAQQTLTMIASLLDLTPRTHNVVKILNARVPIIRFRNMAVNLNCDISIQAMDSIKMTELLYLYSVCDVRVKPLMAGIKQWATSQRVTSSGEQQKTTTIGFLMMLIFYLQTRSPPVLPTLRQLQSLASTTEMFYIENIVYGLPSHPSSIPRSQNKESIESLFRGFFMFYSEFDFKNKAVSVIEGTTFSKPANSTAVHIENPLCIGLNICRNVGNSQLDLLTSAMKTAALKLEEMASQRGSNSPNSSSSLSNKSQKSRLSVLFNSSDHVENHSVSVDISELFPGNDLAQTHDNLEDQSETGNQFDLAQTRDNSEDQSETGNQFDPNGAELSEDTYTGELSPPHRLIAPDTIQNVQPSLELQKINKLSESSAQDSGIEGGHKPVILSGKSSRAGTAAAKKAR